MGRAAKRKRVNPKGASATGAVPHADTPPRADAPPRAHLLGPAIAAFGVVAFLVLKCFALHPHRADEGIYFYDAVRWADGARLYRSLFFAHPPLHLLLPALIEAISGYSFLAFKAVPQLAAALECLLVYAIACRLLKSEVAAVVALYSLLFAADFLKASSFFTGINVADMTLLLGIWLLISGRAVAGGVAVGMAVMTLLQTAPVAFAVMVAAGTQHRLSGNRSGKRFVIALVVTVVVINLAGAVYAGRAFFDEVFLYHLEKRETANSGAHELGILVADELGLFIGALLAFAIGMWLERSVETRRILLALGGTALLQILFVVTRPVAFPFYYQPAFPALAILVGWGAREGWERGFGGKSFEAKLAGVGIAAVVLGAPVVLSSGLTALVSPMRASQRASYSQSYEWKDAPLIGPLNGVVRALFFSDGERHAGERYWGITEYLWNMSRGFDAYAAIVQAVIEHSTSTETLFGDSASAPLVSLGSRRRLALDLADTNVQRFTSGITAPASMIAQLEAHGGPALLLASGNSGLFSLPEFQRYREAHYRQLASFTDGDNTRYTLYRRAVEEAAPR